MRRRILILGIFLGLAFLVASVPATRFGTSLDSTASREAGSVQHRSKVALPVPATRSETSFDSSASPETESVHLYVNDSPVEELNYVIQERFRNAPGAGMARMPVVPEHTYRFNPKGKDEKNVVQ